MNNTINILDAISPVDGRYASKTSKLRAFTSEHALIYYRVVVEVNWFKFLASQDGIPDLPELDVQSNELLNKLIHSFSTNESEEIKEFEAKTNHDVKAVEYFLKSCFLKSKNRALIDASEFIHFACTSEDINNLAYALMLRDARDQIIAPEISALRSILAGMASNYAESPMLARTHGQVASPTTMGKEIAVFASRLQIQLKKLKKVAILGKLNGAVGNYNAHLAAYPDFDWLRASQEFVESLGLEWNPITTQIEPHDYIAELFNTLERINTIVLDLDRDLWSYISIGYFKQKKIRY